MKKYNNRSVQYWQRIVNNSLFALKFDLMFGCSLKRPQHIIQLALGGRET